MPAKSKKQQRLFGAVHACQKSGKCASPEVKKVAKSISYKDADEFASTKHKGLPEKVEKEDKKDESRLSSFKNYIAFREAQGCQCSCKSCKEGKCGGCSCPNCSCSNCHCR